MNARPSACVELDPSRLEHEFLQALAARRKHDPAFQRHPRLLLAPTQSLLDHLARSMTRRFGSLANLHLHHYHSLTNSLQLTGENRRLWELPALWQREVLKSTLPEQAPRVGLGPLMAAFRDLRDAGFHPSQLPKKGLSKRARTTLDSYQRYVAVLEELARDGFGDRAAIAQNARDTLAQGHHFVEAYHYGAYDVIGVHEGLLKTLGETVPTHHWIPGTLRGQASRLPREFLQRLQAAPARQNRHPPKPPRISILNASDRRAEVRFALRTVLSWQAEGVPVESTSILTRTKEPYAAAILAETRVLGLPLAEPVKLRLSEHPKAVNLRALLEHLKEPDHVALKERCLRLLPQHFGGPAALADWRRAFERAGATPHRLELLADVFSAQDDTVVREWLLSITPASHSFASMDAPALLDALQYGLEQQTVTSGERGAGIRVLDFQQARGLPLRRAILVGTNEGICPRVAREDPFLPDRDRRLLRQATGLKIPLKRENDAEERLLFELMMQAPAEQLLVSSTRSDELGRVQVASPYLGELEQQSNREIRISPHPKQQLDQMLDETGLLHPREALILAALHPGGGFETTQELARSLGQESVQLQRAFAMLAATERWRPGPDLPYDGAFGPPEPNRRFTATSLSALGQCPLRFGFRYLLGIDQDEDPVAESDLTAREAGILVHDVLERLYQSIQDSGIDPDQAPLQDPGASIRTLWNEAVKKLRRGRAISGPLLEIQAELWTDAIRMFVRNDVERLRSQRARIQELETSEKPDLMVADMPLRLSLRYDRIVTDENGHEQICDYKTGPASALRWRTRIANVLRGKELQLALYWLARNAAGKTVSRLELATVAPATRQEQRLRTPRRVELDLDRLQQSERELVHTLKVLLQQAKSGQYPLISRSSPRADQSELCGRCEFRRACRHTHMPTIHRVEQHHSSREFLELSDRRRRPAKET